MPDPSSASKYFPLLAAALVVTSVATSLAPVGGLTYTIEQGDALSNIALEHGVSVEDLVATNNLADPNLIVAGLTLTIPQAGDEAVADSAPAPATAPTHSVKAGDSLWAIAGKYDVALSTLTGLNNIGRDDLIHPGQELILSSPTPDDADILAHDTGTDHQSNDTAAPPPTPGLTLEHVVGGGDTLWDVAGTYGVALDDLLATNELNRDSVITVGQTLLLPPNKTIDTTALPADLAADPKRLALMPLFDYWANEYAVPPDLLKALTWFESGWNNEKRSSAAAIGIGQLLPITADFVSESLLGQDLDPYVAAENIQMSARFLRYLLDQTRDVRFAVASYYQGLTATRQHGVYRSSVFYVEGVLAMRARFK